MNFELSDEQQFLREAARGALSRHKTVEAAREALDGGSRLPDLWDVAREAGWPGLLVSEDHGGAGLGALDAMLVMAEAGRVLARRAAAGPRARDRDPRRDRGRHDELLGGARRGREARGLRAPRSRPSDTAADWTVDPSAATAARRRAACDVRRGPTTRRRARSPGCPTRPAPTSSWSIAVDDDGAPVALAVEAGRRRRRGRGGDRATTPPARSGTCTFDGAGGARSTSTRRARRGLVPRAGADRRRVARRGGGVPGDARSPTPRSASRSAARSAPTRRSSTR